MARPGSTAFTLLELMVAMVFFAIGTLAVMALIQRAHAAMVDGDHVLLATHLAQQELEELRNVAFDDPRLDPGPPRACINTPAPGLPQFTCQVSVSPGPSADLKAVAVVVSWRAPGPGGQADVTLQTFRSAV